MAGIVSSQILDLEALDESVKEQLVDELYAIQVEVFDGVDKAEFAKYVIYSAAQENRMMIHKNEHGLIVGYCAIHFFTQTLSSGLTTIIRMEAGSLREYRGNNKSATFTFRKMLMYRLRHPLRTIFYLGTLVHPSSYMIFEKYAPLVWPNAQREMPQPIQTLMQEVKRALNLTSVSETNAFVVNVGWQTKDTAVERRYWQHSDREAARFFVQTNPSYSQGHGLMTIVPLALSDVLKAVKKMVGLKFYQWGEAQLMQVQRIPGLRPLLQRKDIMRRLKQVEMFKSLSQAQLQEVVNAADTLSMSAGSFLFHEGDPGNEMYILASGSLYVIDGHDIIDQVTPGTVFGELAMLAGEARTAAIRTATKVRLIRLQRSALINVMQSHPEFHSKVWDSFYVRRFLAVTSTILRFQPYDRTTYEQWFQQSEITTLEKHQTVELAEAWHFLAVGVIECKHADLWMTVRAPSLIETQAPLHIRVIDRSHIMQLPPPPHILPQN